MLAGGSAHTLFEATGCCISDGRGQGGGPCLCPRLGGNPQRAGHVSSGETIPRRERRASPGRGYSLASASVLARLSAAGGCTDSLDRIVSAFDDGSRSPPARVGLATSSARRVTGQALYPTLLQAFWKIALRPTFDDFLQCDAHPRGIHALKPPNLTIEDGAHH